MRKIIHGLFIVVGSLLALLIVGLFFYFWISRYFFDEYYKVGRDVPQIPHSTKWKNIGKQCWGHCWGQMSFQLDKPPEQFKAEYAALLEKNGWEIIDIYEEVEGRIAITSEKQINETTYTLEVDYDYSIPDSSKYKNSYIYIRR